MNKYRTPNGNILTEEQLLSKYGAEKFQEFLNQGKLTLIGDEDVSASGEIVNDIFVTPNGNELTQEELINQYGEQKFNTFVSDGRLKKKSLQNQAGSTSELGDLELETIDIRPEPTEEDYFTGTFGDILRGFDDFTHTGLGDFIDDMARSVASGYYQGVAAENASDLLLRGSLASPEDIYSYIEANKNTQKYGPSAEMQEYQQTYEDNGSGFMGVVMGLSKSGLTILPELIVSSLTSMASNTDALGAFGAGIGTGATYGAVTGAAAGGVGAIPGAVAGAASALPYAFAAAGSALEMGATFSELLQEEVGGKELTPDLIESVLNDEEAFTRIRNKAIARGITIGAIDAYTGKLGGKIAGKILTKGGTQTAKQATRGQVLKSIAGASGVEAVGGSVGEATARGVIGQEMDVSEIALEGLAETPGGVKDLVSARFSAPKYKVNGERVNAETLDNLIETMTLEEIQKAEIQIDNDYDGRAQKLQDRIEELSVKDELKKANADLSDSQIEEIAILQLELNKLEGNKTEVGKRRAAELRKKINELTDANTQEATDADVQSAEVTDEEVLARLKEISNSDVYTQEAFDAVKAEMEQERADAAAEGVSFEAEKEFDKLDKSEQDFYLEAAEGDRQLAIDNYEQDVQNLEFGSQDETRFSLGDEDANTNTPNSLLNFMPGQGLERQGREEDDVSADVEVDRIADEMNQLGEEEINFTTPAVSSKTQTNTIAESNSTVEFTEQDAKELGFESLDDMNREMSYYDGIPMVTGISDILASGTIKDSRGNDMEVNGGIGYNTRGKNKDAAWAGVDVAKSEAQYRGALKTYEKNKTLFDRLWKEGKLPDGHIPMAIIRMGNDAVNSNEAAFRWAAPEVKAQSQENQTNAMNEVIKGLEVQSTKSPGLAKKANNILKRIKANDIKTLGQLFDFVQQQSQERAKGNKSTLSLDERALLFSNIMSPPNKSGGNTKPIIKALYEGVENPNTSIFNMETIHNAIGEPSMMKTKKGDVVAVVGIDVKNGGVIDVEHRNYGTGPKGRLISFIKNPVNGLDVFPAWKAKANRVFKKDKTGKVPDSKKVADQTMGTAANDKAFQGAVVDTKMTDLQVLSAKLRFAFPGVSVTTTIQEFNEVLNQPGVRTKESKGKVIYGLTKDGKVFINPEVASLGTPIHEFGHIWIDYLRSKASGIKGTKLLERGLRLVEGTPELQAAIEKYGDNKLAREEALVELMATKGETIINAAKKSRFQNWMNATFKYIKQKMVGTKELKTKSIQDMSLDEFINTGLADLFGGVELSADFNAQEAANNVMPRFSLGDDVGSFIRNARAQGIADGAIRTVLKRRGVSSDVIAEGFKKSKGKANQRTKVSEDFAPGYNRVKKEIKGIVEKSIKRGRKQAEQLKNAINYLKGTKVYENATDVQREMMIRDLRKEFGVKEKRVDNKKIKKFLGIKDPKKITMTEKQLVYQRIKDLADGAKTAKAAFIRASQMLTKEITEMVRAGQISTTQMADIMRRFSRVDMFNPISIERFVDYMGKVMADAEYAGKIAQANAGRGRALKNVGSKIGIADGLVPQLQRLFSVNPSLIPDSVLDVYLDLIEQFKPRKTVLSLEDIQTVTKKAEQVLKQLDEEQSMAIELADRFEASENKVLNDEGKVDYAATIKEMLKEGEITDAEAEVMKKYKSQIMPQPKSVQKSDAEIQAEVDTLVDEVQKSEITLDEDNNLGSQEERDLVKRLKKLIKTDGIKGLSARDLTNLLRVIDNINNGYLPHFAQLIVEKIEANNDGAVLGDAIAEAKPLPLSKIYSRIKSIITRKGAIQEMIRRNPLFNIDQIFGDFKTQRIFNSLFGKAAVAVAKFRNELKGVQGKIEKAEQAVLKSFGRDPNKFTMSKYKQMAYMIQQEFLSNPNNKQVNSVVDFLKETIKRIDEGTTRYTDADAAMLQEILDTYTDENGNFDNQALFDSFNEAEKNSLKVMREINDSLQSKAVYTSTVIRGDRINPLNNYVHLNVIAETNPNEVGSSASDVEAYNNNLRPSTRAKSLIARTGKVSPLNFDIYASVQRGAKYTLMDFHLTEPIRTARRTLKVAEKQLEGGKRMPKKQREIFNAINMAFEESVENLLTNSFQQTSILDDVALYLQRQGYRSILAGTGRFIAELTSNISFALIVDPKGFIAGSKLRGIIGSPKAPAAMANLGSKQVNRVFPNEDLSGKLVDVNILNQAQGVKGGKAKGTVSNFLSKMWNKSGQRWIKGVEFVADGLISTPDKLVMRPMWFGAFSNRFEAITGVKPDFDKIAANDKAYMEKYSAALKESTEVADRKSVMAGATDNAFMGMLKGTRKPNQSASLQAFNAFNNFMTRFLIFEYVTARTGIMNMIGKGDLSKKQGAALLAGVTSRMVLYTLIGQMLAEGMTELFDDDDEFEIKANTGAFMDDEPEFKSFEKRLGQSFASAFTSLLFGRDFGNATKSIINYGIEEFNEEYLQFLRDGDYDPYKDAIQYNIVPKAKQGRGSSITDFLMKMGAAYGPILGTADLLTKKLTEPNRKEPDAIERQNMERYVRLPLELLGNTGFIPLYKDVRKIVLSQIYGDLSRAERQLKDARLKRQEMLNGYDSESDMKRYDPQLWEQTFGPKSQGYDEREALKEIERAKRKLRQQMKDELYDYKPRVKRKRSSGFGPRDKNSSSGFGPRKSNTKGFGPRKSKKKGFGNRK